MNGLDLVHLRPMAEVVRKVTPGASARALGEPGKTYAIYIHHAAYQPKFAIDAAETAVTLTLALPPGLYEASWIDTRSGATAKKERLAGGERALVSPAHGEDIALRIRASK